MQTFNFKLCDNTPVTQSFTIVPVNFPTVSSSFIVNGDTLTSSVAPVSFDLVSNVFKIELNKGASNNWYISASSNTVTASAAIVSGSYSTGSLCSVSFNNINNGRNLDANKTISIKPVNKNVGFGDSFILEDTVYHITDATGSLTVSLVPQVYSVKYYGDVRNTPYTIVVPNSGSVNAKDCIVTSLNVSPVITPKNQSLFAYTAQSSDARYLPISASVQSASYAATASFALNGGNGGSLTTGSTYPITSSWALNTNTASWIDGSNVHGNVNSASNAVLSQIATLAISASYLQGNALVATLTVTGATSLDNGDIITDGAGNLIVNGNVEVIGLTVLDKGAITTDGNGVMVIGGSLTVAGHGITGSLSGTASYANTAKSSSYAQTASFTNKSISASYSVTADSAAFATNATNAVNATNAQTAAFANGLTFTPSLATSSSFASTASFVKNSQTASLAVNATNANFATSAGNASFATVSTSASFTQTASYLNGNANGDTASFTNLTVGSQNEGIAGVIQFYDQADDGFDSITVNDNTLGFSGNTVKVDGGGGFGAIELYDSVNSTYRFIVATDGGLRTPSGDFFNVQGDLIIGGNLFFNNATGSSVTASLKGTASFANSASYAATASYVTASNVKGTVTSSSYAVTASYVSASSFTGSLNGTASYASTIPQQIKVTGVTASVLLSDTYQFSSSFTTTQTGSYTITNADNGKFVCVISGSPVNITLTTSSISNTFNATYFQSGSGTLNFLTASNSVILRNRGNHTGSAGQYAMVSIVRVPSGDFVLGGDIA